MIAATSSASTSGVTSTDGSSTVLRPIPLGSYVTTVWSLASRSASGANGSEVIGCPMTSRTGPEPRTS